MRLSRRRPVAGRRPEAQRGAPEPSTIPWPRVLGVLGMAAVVGVGAWFLGDPTFRVDPRGVTVTGARFTDESAIRARTGLMGDARPSVFVLATRRMESDLEAMPTVVRADVTATLPDRVAISIVERTPMVAWLVGDDGFLVDVEGIVLGPTSAIDAAELGDGSTGSSLPALTDAREGSRLVPGERVDPVDLEAVRLLGAVTPELIGSEAPALTLSVDDDSGYVLEWPDHWRAVFGHYTRTLLPPDRIPAQVQCLGELLREREDSVAGATLAVSADRCGTFLPGATEPTRRPRRTPRPTREP
jgi:hypothetical protein